MISKSILPSSWFKDYPASHLIDVHSRGVDKMQMAKIAASDYVMHMDIKPEKGKSFVHLITTGAGEYYGPNNNADFFNEKEGTVEIPHHHKTGGRKSKSLDGGLSKFHSTFSKYGGVYREHHNSRKGAKSLGDVVLEAYNPAMHRGELVVKLDNEKWASSLNKLASNVPVLFSMGCGVPFDICSVCGNEAKTRSDYCDHLRYNKLGITKEGHQVYAINDKPHFHDISEVAIPADRIAFALAKVASSGSLADMSDVEATHMYLPLSLVSKMGSESEKRNAESLSKLAEIEKKILAEGLSPEDSDLSLAFEGQDVPEDIIKKLQGFPLEDVLGCMANHKIMLPPEAFAQIVLKKGKEDIPGIDGMCSALGDTFTDSECGCASEAVSDSSYTPISPNYWRELEEVAKELKPNLSVEDDPVRRRITLIVIRGDQPPQKRASMFVEPTMSAESRVLAREYAKYQISFLAGIGADKYAHRVVVHNQAKSLN